MSELKTRPAPEAPPEKPKKIDWEARIRDLEAMTYEERVDAICGMFAHIPYSSEDFLRDKRREIELEYQQDR